MLHNVYVVINKHYTSVDLIKPSSHPQAVKHCSSNKSILQGVDFFFSKRSHAQRFLDFLQGVVPLRYRTDKQLVSHNEQNASYNYKYTFSVEIVPICKVRTAHCRLAVLKAGTRNDACCELVVSHTMCILCSQQIQDDGG